MKQPPRQDYWIITFLRWLRELPVSRKKVRVLVGEGERRRPRKKTNRLR